MTVDAIIIGGGNVAGHMADWLADKGISARQISSRTFLDSDGRPISAADIYIIAVLDDAISSVGVKLKEMVPPDSMVVHTSGTRSCDELAGLFRHYGVLYPMQTFSKGRPLDYESIPLFIEAGNESDTARLEAFARRLSRTVCRLDSRRRKALHIAAVFASNYVNRMLVHAADVLADCPFGIEILNPLMEETIAKAIIMGPREAQTGPARRGDTGVLNAHLDALENSPDAQAIYSLLARQIQKDYGL